MAKMKFGATKDGMASTSVARLETPYIGDATLVRVGSQTIELKDESTARIIEFDFKLAGMPATDGMPAVKSGIHLQHPEWAPKGLDPDTPAEDGDTPTPEDKVQKQIERIGYMLKYFFGEELAEKVTEVEGDTYPEIWTSLCDRIDAVVKQKAKEMDIYNKTVQVKVVGSVYQGNGSVRLTKYLGFMGDEASGDAVQFSKSERTKNREFLMWRSQQEGQQAGPDDFSAPAVDAGSGDAPAPTAGGVLF